MKISVENVSFSYDRELVLDQVNLSYDSDEFLSIIGPNGGGKSTFLKLLLGILKPSSGKIQIDDKDPKAILRSIGYVPQQIPTSKTFPMSVLEVVLMGSLDSKIFKFYSKKQKEMALNALRKVSMQDFAKRGIGELSGGEKQRVYIARALCSEAKILMLDEPTASIDARGQAEIYSILRDINRSRIGIIMISHDINMAVNFASRVAYINRTLFLHDTSVVNSSDFLSHLMGAHSHFCDVEIALKSCECDDLKESQKS